MAVGGCQKARLLSDYLVVPRLFFNFAVHVQAKLYTALLLIVTEQKIVTADTDSFRCYYFSRNCLAFAN